MFLPKIEKSLLFLTILFLPTQLGRHFWPQFSYIYSLKIDYLSPTIYFWDILALGLFTVWIFQKPKINKPALNLFLIFIFTQLVSLIAASNLGAGLVRLEQFLTAGMLGIYVASQKWKVFKKRIFIPLSTSLAVESILAAVQFLKGGSLGFWILGERTFSITTPAIAKFNFYGIELLRPYGTFSHPNVLAAFLLIGGMCVWVMRGGFKSKSLMFISFITVITTFSRAAIMAEIFICFFVLRKKFFIGLIIGILVVSPLLYERFSSVLNSDNLTILRREELAKSAVELFLRNPLFGIGLNNFIPALSSDIISGPNRFLQPVHNIFLLSLSETGILGLLGLLGLLGYPIYRAFKCQMLLIWCVILFLGMFDHYFLTLPQGYRLLFMFWGMSCSMLESNSESA